MAGLYRQSLGGGQQSKRRWIIHRSGTDPFPSGREILLSQRSIEIFATWEEKYGDDIWWIKGGYTFLAYNESDEKLLKDTANLQKEFGLNINFIEPERIQEIIPGINSEGLRGGIYSPDDGNASPLLSLHAFFRQSKNYGADYKFKEEVIDILEEHNAKSVQMHMFTTRSLLKRVIDNGWLISVNTLLLRSKNVRKIVRDCPIKQLMLETDSPWLGIGNDGNIKPKNEV